MEKSDFYRDALPDSRGPLAGYTVLEATHAVAGPAVGTVLGDLGATVIRTEMPGKGELIRAIPPFVNDDEQDGSTWYQTVNRGKKSITLDLRKPRGQELFRQLASRADVVVENFTPGVIEKWNLGYEAVSAVNPGVVYVSVSGFGQWGPLRNKRGMDSVAQAMSGVMSVTGEMDGQPLIIGVPVIDYITGWQGANGAMAALLYREKSGHGQYIDISLADTALALSDHHLMSAAHTGFVKTPHGNSTPQGAPANSYRCRDNKYVFVFALIDGLWENLCRAMDRKDLVDDERCNTIRARTRNIDFIDQAVAEWTAQHDSQDVVSILDQAGVTVGPVMNYAEVGAFPHYREHESVVEMDHPTLGPLTTYGVPPKFSLTPARLTAAAPTLGQHNEEIYRGMLSLEAEEIAQLQQDNVI